MTDKDYTEPQTIQAIIRKSRNLQMKFNSEINLDFLEKAIRTLNTAIENTPQNHPSKQAYVNERNRQISTWF